MVQRQHGLQLSGKYSMLLFMEIGHDGLFSYRADGSASIKVRPRHVGPQIDCSVSYEVSTIKYQSWIETYGFWYGATYNMSRINSHGDVPRLSELYSASLRSEYLCIV